MSIETPKKPEEPLLPQQYEEATGGGALAAEMARRGLSRRQVLRRAVGGVLGLVGAEAIAGSLAMFYPNLAGQFGSIIDVGPRSNFKVSAPHEAVLDSQGIFYAASAKAYIVHLTAKTPFLLGGAPLENQIAAETWVKDTIDGTYWIALYQKCVHLGCRVPFRDDCHSFKCPCHGSHYNVDGEYLDGPAPRSLDRFKIVYPFQGPDLMVDTGTINNLVQRPSAQTRLISTDGTDCGA